MTNQAPIIKKVSGHVLYYLLVVAIVSLSAIVSHTMTSGFGLTIAILFIGSLILIGIACIKQPFIFPLIFFSLCYFRLTNLLPMLNELSPVFMVAIATAVHLFLRICLGIAPIIWDRILSAFYSFSLWVSMSAFLSNHATESIKYLTNTYSKPIIGFYLTATNFYTENRVRILMHIYPIMSQILSGHVIYNKHFMDKELLAKMAGRAVIAPETGLGDPNDSAYLLLGLLGFCLAIFYAPAKSKLMRMMAIASIITSVIAIGYTQSRGALVGFAGIGLSVCIIAKAQGKLKKTLIQYSPIALIGLCAVIYSGGFLERLKTDGMSDTSAQHRFNQWYAARQITKKNPFFGSGPKTFSLAANDLGIHISHTIHSSFFGVMSETGLVGLLLYHLFLFYTLQTCFHFMKEKHSEKQGDYFYLLAMGIFISTFGLYCAGFFLRQMYAWPLLFNCALAVNISQHKKLNRLKQH